MTAKTLKSSVADAYLRLIYRFALRPIRSDRDLDRAIAVIDSLLDKKRLLPAEQDYLDVLSDLVEQYESKVHPMQPVSDAAMLRHLIEAKGISQAQVARDTGIPESIVSEVLADKRRLSRRNIGRLAEYFNVSTAVFAS